MEFNNKPENMVCRECNGIAHWGYAPLQKSVPTDTSDFSQHDPENFGQTLRTVHIPNILTVCYKCKDCGHSWKAKGIAPKKTLQFGTPEIKHIGRVIHDNIPKFVEFLGLERQRLQIDYKVPAKFFQVLCYKKGSLPEPLIALQERGAYVFAHEPAYVAESDSAFPIWAITAPNTTNGGTDFYGIYGFWANDMQLLYRGSYEVKANIKKVGFKFPKHTR